MYVDRWTWKWLRRVTTGKEEQSFPIVADSYCMQIDNGGMSKSRTKLFPACDSTTLCTTDAPAWTTRLRLDEPEVWPGCISSRLPLLPECETTPINILLVPVLLWQKMATLSNSIHPLSIQSKIEEILLVFWTQKKYTWQKKGANFPEGWDQLRLILKTKRNQISFPLNPLNPWLYGLVRWPSLECYAKASLN